ncbi:MAG TPA: hypothetical protein PLP23_14770 [Panacibacter sp.]|nr:hypothetical protein [Panacibacter sp.]
MIDGFKFKFTEHSDVRTLFRHPLIDKKAFVSVDTGLVYDQYLNAKYKGIRFQYNDDKEIFVRGNLYKYYTGLKNFNNFKVSDAIEALKQLECDLGVDFSKAEVMRLEWGLNIDLPSDISVNRFIENVLTYKGRIPDYKQYPGGGLMRTFDLTEFFIKFYDKSAQAKNLSNVLRMELVGRRKTFFKRIDIKSVSDLYKTSSVLRLQEELMKINSHIIFYDNEIETGTLLRKDMQLIADFNRPLGWHNLMKFNPELYRKKKPQFRKRITEISGINWNECLKEMITIHSSQLF